MADLDFFFDPVCPFAWQASRWIRHVVELEGIEVEWRFVSLHFLNEDKYAAGEVSPQMRAHHDVGLRYHRVLAAIRAREGSARMGDLYAAFTGPRFGLPRNPDGSLHERPVEEILAEFDLPLDMAAEADNESWDAEIRVETELAIERTGPDVGTPILTFDPPDGNSFFGPVISTVPENDEAVEMFEAMHTLAEFPSFSELKRSARSPLDLVALQST
jgi:hypothetical protein